MREFPSIPHFALSPELHISYQSYASNLPKKQVQENFTGTRGRKCARGFLRAKQKKAEDTGGRRAVPPPLHLLLHATSRLSRRPRDMIKPRLVHV